MQEVNQSTTVPSVNGAADLAAVTVFAYAIAFLKDHLLEAISNQTGRYVLLFKDGGSDSMFFYEIEYV